MNGNDDRDGEVVRRIAARAIRRLDVLEYAILGAAAVLAIIAGALVAVLLDGTTGLPFRPTWIVASLLFFVVPAGVAWWRDRDVPATGPPESPPGPGP
jgi:uncharacterized membrane protein